MTEKKFVLTRIFNILAVVLLLAILVYQFVPCWTLEDQSISIGEYVWHPHEHKDFTKNFAKTLDTEKDSGSVAGVHIVFAVGFVLSAVYCIKNSAGVLPALISVVVGAFGVSTLTSNPLLKVSSVWMILLILSIALIVAGVAALAARIVPNVVKKK